MIRALYERSVTPDLIVGSSVGAINGAFIASRPPVPETADELAEVWHRLRRSQVFPLGPLTGFFGFFGAHDYLVSDSGLQQLIERHIEFAVLEKALIPVYVIATDLLSGEELRLSRGDALQALLASAAIPGVFAPVEWEGRRLIDGGVSNNTPIADAIELGAEKVYVLPAGNACELPDPPRGALAMLLHATSLLIMSRLLVEVEALRSLAELIVLPPPCPLAITPIDFSHSDQLIRRGYEDSRDYLDAVEAGRIPQPSLNGHHRRRLTAVHG